MNNKQQNPEKPLLAGNAFDLIENIEVAADAVVSKTLTRSESGSITLFAMDNGQEISSHSAPKDAYVLVLEGELFIRVGSQETIAAASSLVSMPAQIAHALEARKATKFLLFMQQPS